MGMPFYCPTQLSKRNNLFFGDPIANWAYIETYRLCNNEPDCIDASDEIFCNHNALKDKNQKTTLAQLLKTRHERKTTNDANVCFVSLTTLVVSLFFICS